MHNEFSGRRKAVAAMSIVVLGGLGALPLVGATAGSASAMPANGWCTIELPNGGVKKVPCDD